MTPQLRNILILLGAALTAFAGFFFGRSTAELDLPPPVVAEALDPAVAVDVKVWPPQAAIPTGGQRQHYAAVLYSDGTIGCSYPESGPWPPECHQAAALLDMSLLPGQDSIVAHSDTVRSALVVNGVTVYAHETIITHADTVRCPTCPPPDTTPPPADTLPPAAPSNLTRTQTPTSIDLAWMDNADNETGFEVWRCMECIDKTAGWLDWGLHATVGANVVAHRDTVGLVQNKEFCWRVRATNAIGASPNSNTVCKRHLP